MTPVDIGDTQETLQAQKTFETLYKCPGHLYESTVTTRMHSSRIHTAHSLTVSRSICHACPCHTCPPAMHTPLPCMPPPCTPPATHTHPAMHIPPPCMPHPNMHIPCHTCPPYPWTEFLTHASENITLPQLRCGR